MRLKSKNLGLRKDISSLKAFPAAAQHRISSVPSPASRNGGGMLSMLLARIGSHQQQLTAS
jgi:hypothetical protein